MERTLRKAVIKEMANCVVEVLHYDVRILNSVDQGENWYYAGEGRYFETLEAAEHYANLKADQICYEDGDVIYIREKK